VVRAFLWERPRFFTVRNIALILAALVMLDYDIGQAMADGLLPQITPFSQR
jgi:hypothetical protein